MPAYDYECEDCGPFTEIRPMAEFEQPQACPGCGSMAGRVILTAPYFSGLSQERRLAHVTNERSANAPGTLSALKNSHKHGPGCGCGSSSKKSKTVKAKDGAKSFPSKRPWMISH